MRGCLAWWTVTSNPVADLVDWAVLMIIYLTTKCSTVTPACLKETLAAARTVCPCVATQTLTGWGSGHRGASGSPTHSAVVDNENVAHTGKSIGFSISEAGVGIAIDVARQILLLARASTATKGQGEGARSQVPGSGLVKRIVRAQRAVPVSGTRCDLHVVVCAGD